MRIVTLTKKQLKYFKEQDPFEFRGREDLDLTLCLGAVCETEEEEREGDLPAGLLLGTKKADSLILLWLYVDPFFRRRGIGEALLLEAFEEAENNGLTQVAAVFPKDFGRELVCATEKEFFGVHGFTEEKPGRMVMPVSALGGETSYSGPSFMDEAFAMEALLTEEEDTAPVKQDYDDRDFFEKTHKNWEIKRVVLKEIARNRNLHSTGQKLLKGLAPVRAGNIGELTFTEYKQILSLCEKHGHSGFPEALFDIPADYFDLEVSSYVKEDTDGDDDYDDEQVNGVCLIHYNRKEKALYVELLFAIGKERIRSLGELIRCSMIAAVEKYPEDTAVVLPYDREFHVPLLKKLFEE